MEGEVELVSATTWRQLGHVAESITRLTISHIVLPLHPPHEVAAHLAALAVADVLVRNR